MTETTPIEILESRIAPAAVVTVELANGALKLTGDNGDATVTLSVLDDAHSVLVAGPDTTFTLGASSGLTFVKLDSFKSLNATFGSGVDRLVVAGLDLAGDATIDLGGGADNSLELDSITTKGSLSVTAAGGNDQVTVLGSGAQIKGSATFTLGDAGSNGNRLDMIGTSFLVGKDFSYTGGAQDDDVSMNTLVGIKGAATVTLLGGNGSFGALGSAFQVGKKLSIQATDEAAGPDPNTQPAKEVDVFLVSPSLAVGGDLEIKTGAGRDSLTVGTFGGKSAIRGKLSVSAGDGQDTIAAFLYGGIAKSILIDGGDGENQIIFALAAAGSPQVKVVGGKDADLVYGVLIGAKAGSIVYDLGDAVDVPNPNDPGNPDTQTNGLYSIVVSSTVKSIAYVGGAQADSLFALNLHSKVPGGIDADFGAGSLTSFAFGFGGSTGPLAIAATGGTGDVSNVVVGGAQTTYASIDIATGDAPASVQLQPDFGSFPIPLPIPGFSLPALGGLLQGWTVKGATKITTGAGGDVVQMSGTAVSFGGGLNLDLGGGDNSFQSESEGLRAKTITYKGGAGADAFSLAGHAQLGPVTVDLGDGVNNVSLEGSVRAIALASLQVTSTSVTDADSLTLSRVQVFGPVKGGFGGGVSSVKIDDSIFRGTVDFSTAGGNDTVLLDTIQPWSPMPLGTSFLKAVKIDLGADNDTLTIGGSEVDRFISTQATLSADGGSGTNSLNFTASDNDLAKAIETKNFS